MESIDQPTLTLIKCQPEQILFIDRNTRIVYRYLDTPPALPQQPQLAHPYILPATPFQQGFLYPKEQSTLQAQITQRARSHIKQQFSQEEIANTFEPLFQCLEYLHQKGVTHGSVHLESIVIIDDEIKIRDWNAPTQLTCQYYPQQKQPSDDIQALGQCLINCILLTTEKLVSCQKAIVLENIIDRYSKPFMLALIVIINEQKEHYSQMNRLLRGRIESQDSKLIEAYQKIRLQKDRKKKHNAHQFDPSGNQLGGTIKKIIFGPGKKLFHHENIENKIDHQVKINAEHLVKKHEKNSLGYDLMGKKLNEQESRLKEESIKRVISKPAILNLSNFGVQNNSKKLTRQRTSPLVKSRNYSRKK